MLLLSDASCWLLRAIHSIEKCPFMAAEEEEKEEEWVCPGSQNVMGPHPQPASIYRLQPHAKLPQPEDQRSHRPSLQPRHPLVFTTGVIKMSHSVSMRLLQQAPVSLENTPSFLPRKQIIHSAHPLTVSISSTATSIP